MPRYKVTVTAQLVIEVDAPREAAALGAIKTAFKSNRPYDALQGTRFTFDSTERECSNPRLMTTTIIDDSRLKSDYWAEVEEA